MTAMVSEAAELEAAEAGALQIAVPAGWIVRHQMTLEPSIPCPGRARR